MNYKSLNAVISLIILIAGFSFYWYSYRPSKIRAKCSANAEFSQIFNNNDDTRSQGIKDKYSTCLHNFGLEK